MSEVSKILKPRRGTSTIMSGSKANTVLQSGELFIEAPSTGVGSGKSKIKIGDGSTVYSSLPYAIGDTSTDPITYTADTSTTVATALSNAASGGTLASIVAGLKQAISLCNTAVGSLSDDLSTLSGTVSSNSTSIGTLSGQVGLFEFRENPTTGDPEYRKTGADTWSPFIKRGYLLVNILLYETTTGTGGIYVKNVDATPNTYKTEFIEYNDTAKTFTAKRNGIFVITVDRASRSIIRVYYNSTSTYSQYTSTNI